MRKKPHLYEFVEPLLVPNDQTGVYQVLTGYVEQLFILLKYEVVICQLLTFCAFGIIHLWYLNMFYIISDTKCFVRRNLQCI